MSAFLILAALFPQTAQAEEPSVWVMSGMWSVHPNEDYYHYNQKNSGWGLAYEDHDHDHTYIVGDYFNSVRQDSKYIGMIHDPWSVGPVRFGYMAGLISGYSTSPRYIPVAAPMASYEYRGIGLNFVWVPSVVVAVQLKVKVW